MSDYPGNIDSHREYANIPGRTFNPADSKNIFAEDLIDLWDAIIAIQNTLGINPQGGFATVKNRLDADVPFIDHVLATERGERLIWRPGDRIIT